MANTIMDLSLLITDPNLPHQVVELHLCPERITGATNPVPVGWKHPPPAASRLHGFPPCSIYEYHHRDMVCSYDKGTDAQRVSRKRLLQEQAHGNLYGACYVEDTVPIHRFPCTQEITHECEVIRTSMRINNRMFLHYDRDGDYHYMYIRYQHAPNVDLKKMQDDMDRTLRTLSRSRQ